MIREFGKTTDTTTPILVETKAPDDAMPRGEETEALRPFHVEAIEEDPNNTAKIIGGVVVGLMIIGGGLYAYETSSHPAQQQVALKTPTENHAAMDQTAATPLPPTDARPDTSAAPAPTPATAPTPPRSHRVIKSADKGDNNAMTAEPAPAPSRTAEAADAAINAPMTLTPQTAPPPEQAGGQTAMQQPLTAPNVTDQTNQPAPAVANNDLPRPGAPVIQPQLATPATPAPTPQAQVPADQAQQPAAQ